MTTTVAVPLLPPRPKPVEEMIIPVDPISSTEPVKPLAGGPTPPEIEEPLTPPAKDAVRIPMEERFKNPAQDVKMIPKVFGPGDVGIPGAIDFPGFLPDQLDRVPRAKVQLPPDYPSTMRQNGINGTVLVGFDVDTAGRVVRAEALRYSHREFAKPAVRAVRQWRFEPGRRHGKVVPFRMAVPIEFGIEAN